MDNIFTAAGYTLLLAVVSMYYWFEGRKKGVTDTLLVFHEYEPDALKRVQRVLKEKLDVSDS